MVVYKLVGYWNGSTDSPEISFNVPYEVDDTRKLVVIHLEEVDSLSKDVKGLESTVNKVTKSFDKLLKSTKHLEKLIK